MIFTKLTITPDDRLVKMAKKKKINLTNLMNQTLAVVLDIPESRHDLEKQLKETEEDIASLISKKDLILQKINEIKTKPARTLDAFIRQIDESDRPDMAKENLKLELYNSIDCISKNKTFAAARSFRIKNKFGITIEPELLIKFSEERTSLDTDDIREAIML